MVDRKTNIPSGLLIIFGCVVSSVECECDDEQLQLRVRLQHVPIVKAGGRVGQFGSGSEM